MGVKLKSIVVREKLEYERLAGKIIAVDAPNIIMGLFNFSLNSSGRNSDKIILDRTQRPISHMYGLLYRINFYYSKKIFPVFCFDGKDLRILCDCSAYNFHRTHNKIGFIEVKEVKKLDK